MGAVKEDYPGLRASKLRDQVLIQERVETIDGAGAMLPPSWRTIGRAYANVTPFSLRRGGEAVHGEELKTLDLYRVVMRFRTDVTTVHRLQVVGPPSINLNIVSVADPDRRRRQINLVCEAGLVDG